MSIKLKLKRPARLVSDCGMKYLGIFWGCPIGQQHKGFYIHISFFKFSSIQFNYFLSCVYVENISLSFFLKPNVFFYNHTVFCNFKLQPYLLPTPIIPCSPLINFFTFSTSVCFICYCHSWETEKFGKGVTPVIR